MDFSDAPVVKNLPADAEETGSIPGLRRYHLPRATKPCATTIEACDLEPMFLNKKSHHDQRKTMCSPWRPVQPKVSK